MSYHLNLHIPASSRSTHKNQFIYADIGLNYDDFIFLHEYDLMNNFNKGLENIEHFIMGVHRSSGRRLILCLDSNPIDVLPFVNLMQRIMDPQDWFVLTNDYAQLPTSNTAPWPFFLIEQQQEDNFQLKKQKQHRIGFLSGVARPNRILLWQAVSDFIRDDDVVVINQFGIETMYNFNNSHDPVTNFLKTCSLPWSNHPYLIDHAQDLDRVSSTSSNQHPAFNACCNINAETCDEFGPLFFSEKTWKSYISGCLTVNYGNANAPTWLSDHGVEIWSGDLTLPSRQKITTIRNLFASDNIKDLYYENLSGIEYNQDLIGSRAFLDRVLALTKNKLLTWANNQW